MYRQSFFIVILALILVGVLTTGSRMVGAIPGNVPSSYDPGLTITQAMQTSQKPLLVEFYTDSCKTCQIITPWVHKLSQKYQDQLTYVMIDLDDRNQAQVASIFGVEYVPAIYVFDFKQMSKAQIPTKAYISRTSLDNAIAQAIQEVKTKAGKKANRVNLKM